MCPFVLEGDVFGLDGTSVSHACSNTPFRMTLRSDELPMTVATWFSAVCSLLDRSGLNSGSAVLPAGWPWAGDLTSLCGGCDKSLVLSQRAAVRRGSSVLMCKVRGPESTTTACAL